MQKKTIQQLKIVTAFLCLIILFFSSCKSILINERRYNYGFYLSYNTPQKNKIAVLNTPNKFKKESAVYNNNTCVASVQKAVPIEITDVTQNYIVNKTPDEIIKNKTIIKKKKPAYSSIFLIKKDKTNSLFSPIPPDDPRVDGMGIAAMALGIIGIEYFGAIVILPISLVLMAIFSVIAGFSIPAAFYLSIIAIFLFMLAFIGMVHSIISLLMSTKSMKRINEKPAEFKGYSFAKAGFITGAIVAFLTLLALTLGVIVLVAPAIFGL